MNSLALIKLTKSKSSLVYSCANSCGEYSLGCRSIVTTDVRCLFKACAEQNLGFLTGILS